MEYNKKGFIGRFRIYILLIFIYFICGVGVSYAYFAFNYENSSTIVGNVVNINASLSVELVVGNNDDLVPMMDAALSNAINGVGTTNGACIDSLGNLSCQVYKITLTNNATRLQHLVGTIELYPKSGAGNAYSNLKWQELTNPTTVKSNSIINVMNESILVSGLTLDSRESKTWYVGVWLSETNTDQREIDKGEFGGTVTFEVNESIVEGTFGEEPKVFSQKIIDLYEDGSSIEVTAIGNNETVALDSDGNPQVSLNKVRGIMLDNNGHYRYFGANPNNYLYFNCTDYNNPTADTCELWRIIGVFNDVDDGRGNIESRVKIIRDEEIGSYSYDTSDSTINSGQGTNDWSKSDLMHLLNPGFEEETINNSLYWYQDSGSCYYEKTNAYKDCDFSTIGINEKTRGIIGDAKFYLGTFSSIEMNLLNSGSYVEFMENFYPHQMYNFERSTNVYNCSVDDGACPRAVEWVGKIGIMYPSDYIYATDLSICKENGIAFGWSDWNHKNLVHSNCYDNDWLHTDSSMEWFITPHNEPRYRPFTLQNGKYVFGAYSYHSYEIRPVLYLNSDVLINVGNGSESNPYRLYNV